MFPYFLRWVQDPKGGNGGDDWTEHHIASFVNIAGPMVGVPKALTAMLSGETRDTMSLGSFGAYLLEKFFSRRERANLMRTWYAYSIFRFIQSLIYMNRGGASSMLPKGGDTIWGDHNSAPDDTTVGQHSFGNIISFTRKKHNITEEATNQTQKVVDEDAVNNFSVDSSLDLLYQTANGEYTQMLESNYSMGISESKKELEQNNKDPRKWSNPLESQLPIAPSMKIYCMYGVGLPTERSYYYTKAKDNVGNNGVKCDQDCELNVASLLNGSDIKQEEFIDAVVKKSFHNENEIPQPPPIVSVYIYFNISPLFFLFVNFTFSISMLRSIHLKMVFKRVSVLQMGKLNMQ